MNRVVLGADTADISRFGECKSQALTLTDGIADYAVVAPDNASVFVNKVSVGIMPARIALDKVGIALALYEANVLTVALVSGNKSVFECNGADCLLGQPSQREKRVCKLLLS